MSDGNNGIENGDGRIAEQSIGDNVTTPGNSGYQPAPGEIIIDPTSIGRDGGNSDSGNSDAQSGGRKQRSDKGKPRGRRGGFAASTQKASVNLEVSGVESILLSVHSMLAVLTRVPEFELDKDDANKLAQASVNVGRHYNLEAAQKTVDWTNLAMIVAQIYGAKLLMYRMRRVEKRKPSNVSGEDQVLDFNALRNAGKIHEPTH